MNFVADEGVERQIIDALRGIGHSVRAVAELGPGMTDESVLALAAEQTAILLTLDTDFGELVYRQGRANAGVLLVRLPGEPPERKAALVAQAIERHSDELGRAFSVLNATRLRIRKPAS